MPDLFIGGPDQHGVVRYARELFRIAGMAAEPPVGIERLAVMRPSHALHVHFTDRLFGGTPEDAAAAIERAALVAPLTITVHDVPQASDGVTNQARRVACYRRVVSVARAVACNSEHESALLRDEKIVAAERDIEIIPLAFASRDRVLSSTTSSTTTLGTGSAARPTIAILGFVYPGKGHLEVIESVARLGATTDLGEGGLEVVALGAASAGHEDDVARLRDHAAGLGVTFTVTGWQIDEQLAERAFRATVPIAAHQHVSASASILTWVGFGRRPLVIDSRYGRETLRLRPGTLTLFAQDRMDAAIQTALREPATTRLDPDASTGPHSGDVLERYRRWWDRVLAS